VLKPAYPIATPRLLLRPYADTDLADFYAIRGQPEVCKYLMIPALDREQARMMLELRIREQVLVRAGEALSLAVVLPATGKVVGEAVLKWLSGEHRRGEVGYLLHPDHEGHGYATEAAAAMLRLGFEDLGLHRIVGSLDARNVGSARVLERLGMRREACFTDCLWVKDEWVDELIYAMTEREWAAGVAGVAGAGLATSQHGAGGYLA
jgi:RimJ/RimL family protein N-acetyltransferase